MLDFLHLQSEASDPLQFLKLSQGHDLLKLQICNQQAQLNQISTDIAVSDKLQIISDMKVN